MDAELFVRMLAGAARDPRIRLPVLCLAGVMLMLTLERAVILITMWDRFRAASWREILTSFVVGLRFDVMVACCLAAPLVAVLAPTWPQLLASKWLKGAVLGYCLAVLAVTFFACVADYLFYGEFDHRLDHKVLDYLDNPYIYKIMLTQFSLIPALVATGAVVAGLVWLLRREGFPPGATFALWRALIWPCVAAPLLFIGIRGSFGPKPINSGLAYFSNSMAVAQLTLNGLFTLGNAINSRVVLDERIDNYLTPLAEEEAFKLTAEALIPPQDHVLADSDNPLYRITDTGQPQRDYNIVLVIAESLSWHYVGALGGDKRLSANFDELAQHGVLMDRCFAVSSRTRFATSGILCGHPDLPGNSVTVRTEAQGRFLTMGHLLERRGYENMFLYGGSPLFDHRLAFLRSNAFQTFMFQNDFLCRTFRTHLGWCDEDLFDQAHEEFLRRQDKPFLAVLLTLSFHRPYKIPAGRCEPLPTSEQFADKLTCARYADWAIGQFIRKARQADYFRRTIFVFVGDHTGAATGNPITVAGYRVPLLIYAPAILGDQGRRVSTVCSQTDIAPTLMSLLGGSYEHCFFGSDVLRRPAGAGMALMQRNGKVMAFMGANQDVVVVPFGGEVKISRFTPPQSMTPLDARQPAVAARAAELTRKALAILQTADAVFRRGTYRLRSPSAASPQKAARPHPGKEIS